MMSDIAGSRYAVTPNWVVLRTFLALSSGVLHIACGALGGTEINGPCMKKCTHSRKVLTSAEFGEART